MPTDHSETQPQPNLSTEHQREGDARRPSDTLDRGQTDEGNDDGIDTPGGNRQEPVEDRPNVGTTTPDAYPADQRGGGTPA